MKTKTLMRFCRNEYTRNNKPKYDLCRPFVLGGWRYATDGSVLLRHPTDEPDTCGRDLPYIEYEVPVLDVPADGFIRIPPPRLMNFETTTWRKQVVWFDGRGFSLWYLKIIYDLGRVYYLPHVAADAKYKPMRFESGKTQGLLLPVENATKDLPPWSLRQRRPEIEVLP